MKSQTYVVLMGRAVQVDAVPAGLEECLCANALALLQREAIGVRHGVNVKADVRGGSILKV